MYISSHHSTIKLKYKKGRNKNENQTQTHKCDRIGRSFSLSWSCRSWGWLQNGNYYKI